MALVQNATAEGIRAWEIGTQLGVAESTARYHLLRLRDLGLVSEPQMTAKDWLGRANKVGSGRFIAAGTDESPAKRRALLDVGQSQRVYDFFTNDREASLRFAAHRLKMSPASVHHIKTRLMREGIL